MEPFRHDAYVCDPQKPAGMIPDELMQTIRAFQESRVILTALELDLFTAVNDGAGAAEAARRAGTDPRATEMLLNALVAMGLLTKQEGVFHNTPVAARYFDSRSPESARTAMMHTVHVFDRWAGLTEKVRGGPAAPFPWTEAFIAAMHYNAADRAPSVVRAVGAEGVRRMLDVGGGSGAYSIAFARANPELHADVLDRPEVTAIARRHIRAAGLDARIATIDGDLTRDTFGAGYGLVLISAICHMLSPRENLDLLERCREALAPGGRVVIQDFILNSDKTGPKTAALFSLNMLVATEAGASYSEEEYVDWLGRARFTGIRRVPLPGPAHLMVAWAAP
ncbi:MAG: methyltransferase [Bryobacteraceae bacterium]